MGSLHQDDGLDEFMKKKMEEKQNQKRTNNKHKKIYKENPKAQ